MIRRMEEKLISVSEAAEKKGVSRQRIVFYIQKGRLPAQLIGAQYVISESDLNKLEVKSVGRPPKAKSNGKAKPKKASKKA